MEDLIDIVKRYGLARKKMEEALYKCREGDKEVANEELLYALDVLDLSRVYIDDYMKRLRSYQDNLMEAEEKIIEAIKVENLEEKIRIIEQTKEKYNEILDKLWREFRVIEIPSDNYKYN